MSGKNEQMRPRPTQLRAAAAHLRPACLVVPFTLAAATRCGRAYTHVQKIPPRGVSRSKFQPTKPRIHRGAAAPHPHLHQAQS